MPDLVLASFPESVDLSVFRMVGGLSESIGSLVDRGPGWGWELVSGLLSIGAGIVAIFWPGITLSVIAILAGVWMIMIGRRRLIAAFNRGGLTAPGTPALA